MKDKKILLEELNKMYSLMNINPSVLDFYQTLEEDFIKHSDLIVEGPETSQGNDDKLSSFKIGTNPQYGTIHYIKEGSELYYLPEKVDIGKLFNLYNNSKYGQDPRGWFEIIEKPSWGPDTSSGNIQTVRRYFPSENWNTFDWLRQQKVPFAFKTKDGIFSMVIKLTNAGLSVTPEDPNDKSKDQSRGWILALPVPGVAATTSGFDYGAGYYNVQTQVPYNQLAPFVEGDPSTSNLDTRTWTDKVMDSWVGISATIVASLAATLAAKRFCPWLTRTFALSIDVVAMRLRLVLCMTIAEAAIQVPMSVYFYQRGEEYEQMGWICLSFVLLPVLSAYTPLKSLIGTEFSDVAIFRMVSEKVLNYKGTLGGFQKYMARECSPQELAMINKFIEFYVPNGKMWAEAMNDYFYKKAMGIYTDANLISLPEGMIIKEMGDIPNKAAVQKYWAFFDEVLRLNQEFAKPVMGATKEFALNIAGALGLVKLTETVYKLFKGDEGKNQDLLKETEDAKKHAKNAKKAINEYASKCPGYDKEALDNTKVINEIQKELVKNTNAKEIMKQLFEDGILSDEFTKIMKRAILKNMLAEKTILKLTFFITYFAGDTCFEEVVKKDYPDLSSEFINFFYSQGYELVNDKEKCKKYLDDPSKEVKCTPCFAKVGQFETKEKVIDFQKWMDEKHPFWVLDKTDDKYKNMYTGTTTEPDRFVKTNNEEGTLGPNTQNAITKYGKEYSSSYTSTETTTIQTTQPQVTTTTTTVSTTPNSRHNCVDGVCVQNNNGKYQSLESCKAKCKK